jgi:hypothetical protein
VVIGGIQKRMVVSEQDLFLMSNLSPKRTGLPFVVWISPKGKARHDVRIKVSKSPKVTEDWVIVAIRPEVRIIHGNLPASSLDALKQWVKLNCDALVRFWEGDIEYTEDVLTQLRPLPKRLS